MSPLNDQYKRLIEAMNILREEIYREEYHNQKPSDWRIQQAACLVSQISLCIASAAGARLKPAGETSEKHNIKSDA